MSTRYTATLAPVPLLAALALAGCNPIQSDRQSLGLQAATSGYQSAIRWGYYETAMGYMHPDLRKGKTTLPPEFKDLRLTGYDVVQPPLVQSPDNATQIVDIEYLYEDRQVLKRLTDRQSWRWDKKLQSWWLQSGLPKFVRD